MVIHGSHGNTYSIVSQSLHNLGYVEEEDIGRVRVEHTESILCCDWMRGVLSGEVGEGDYRWHSAPVQYMGQLKPTILYCINT